MENSVNIRTATHADLENIVEVENACFDYDRFSRRQLNYLIAHAQGVCYVAECKGRIVGYISLLYRAGSSCIRIYSVAVHPDFRGRHLGKKFVDKAKDYAFHNGFHQISLEVKTDNLVAIDLYKKRGFNVISILENYYADLSDAFRMKLQF